MVPRTTVVTSVSYRQESTSSHQKELKKPKLATSQGIYFKVSIFLHLTTVNILAPKWTILHTHTNPDPPQWHSDLGS